MSWKHIIIIHSLQSLIYYNEKLMMYQINFHHLPSPVILIFSFFKFTSHLLQESEIKANRKKRDHGRTICQIKHSFLFSKKIFSFSNATLVGASFALRERIFVEISIKYLATIAAIIFHPLCKECLKLLWLLKKIIITTKTKTIMSNLNFLFNFFFIIEISPTYHHQ